MCGDVVAAGSGVVSLLASRQLSHPTIISWFKDRALPNCLRWASLDSPGGDKPKPWVGGDGVTDDPALDPYEYCLYLKVHEDSFNQS
jgi:hypothetical protein